MRTKKSLINDIKILKANRKSIREFAKEKYVDKDGNAIIDVYVNKDNLFNSLSNPNNPEISDDVFSFIEDQANLIPIEYPLYLNVHTEDDLDPNYIEEKIREHYYKQLIDKEDDLKRNRVISVSLFALGIILLSMYFALSLIPNLNVLFPEILSIAGSFSIWEAVDYALINRSAIKIEYMNLAHLDLIKVKVNDWY